MIECAEDIELLMNWENPQNKKQPVQTFLFSELLPEEQIIIELLRKEGQMHIDRIAREAQMPVNKISGLLLELEFKGSVRCMPGGVYMGF
jgi:DNA processing protein